jgi:pantoate--beta-alanine ligase
MGALHEGHLGLIQRSRSECDTTVCSIFVNPAQFNDPLDFSRYPNRLENDIHLLGNAGTDVLFLPTVGGIYPTGTKYLEQYDLGFLETVFEGKYRPGHFQGVCQVMKRLLVATEPDKLFMGQKDYQQCMVVAKLITIIKMNVELVVCPTMRESDGLAMSSRNLRLTPEQRTMAPRIYELLVKAKSELAPGSLDLITGQGRSFLEQHGFRVDYFDIADANTLEPIKEWDGMRPLVALVAAFAGEVRLIDNMLLTS